VAGDGERGVVQGIGLDESAVEVDAEDRERGGVNFSSREMQKCPFVRLNEISGISASRCTVVRPAVGHESAWSTKAIIIYS
jgi:hypothetical protein